MLRFEIFSNLRYKWGVTHDTEAATTSDLHFKCYVFLILISYPMSLISCFFVLLIFQMLCFLHFDQLSYESDKLFFCLYFKCYVFLILISYPMSLISCFFVLLIFQMLCFLHFDQLSYESDKWGVAGPRLVIRSFSCRWHIIPFMFLFMFMFTS